MTSSDLEHIVPKVSRPWILAALLVWSLGLAIHTTTAPGPLPSGSYNGRAVLVTDVFSGRYGEWAVVRVGEDKLLFDLADQTVEMGRGDTVVLAGRIEGEPGSIAGQRYSAVLDVETIDSVEKTDSLLTRLGRSLREMTLGRLQPLDDGRALLAGFLIGETSSIDPADVQAMRKSGLAHFVAVSGSNVGLFLILLAVIAGPLALGPRRRAVVGLVGLPVYGAITRFEPSVMRASVMAGIALVGRLVGLVLEAWQLLSLAVVALVVLDVGLTANVGFQLSVAATAGVIVGARWPSSNWLTRSLAITLGAQIFVAPLLLVHFESVPLLSPVTNLLTAPVVAAATLLGAVGLGVEPVLNIASWLAEVVLFVARTAASWPQLDGWGVAFAGVALILALVSSSTRPLLVLVATTAVAVAVLPQVRPPPGSVIVLDVGQGDAILIHGERGRFALVDGGPDPVLLEEKLRRYGVNALEIVILTHVHADHAAGLVGVVGRIPTSRVLAKPGLHETTVWDDLVAKTSSAGIAVEEPNVGEIIRFGVLDLRIEGPVRRYESANDESIVVKVIGPSLTMLLSGDIETFAQNDLRRLRADVLKVPHHGGGTSDADWLTMVGADQAIISVGPNRFGHPVPWVIDVLEQDDIDVVRTDESGDVVVDLS